MQCCVPFCTTTSELVFGSEGITFHELPGEVNLRVAWLRALGKENTHMPDSAVVCSKHFLKEDMYESKSGVRQIRSGAIPSTLQVCMMCLDAHSKLFLMKKYKLDGAYESLLGQPLIDQDSIKQTLCAQCAQRLVNFSKFRDKSMRARSLMLELVEKYKLITIQHMELLDDVRNKLKSNIVKTVLKPDHCDLYIKHSEDRQTQLNTTKRNIVTVKNEQNSMISIDGNQTQNIDKVRNYDNFNTNTDVLKEEYLSIVLEPKQSNDPLLVNPSTSKELTDALAPIKYEITFECTVCFEEFLDEDTYNNHIAMHIEQKQSTDEDMTTSGDYVNSSVTPMSWGILNNNMQVEVPTSKTTEPVIKKVKDNKLCQKTEVSDRASCEKKSREHSLDNVLNHKDKQNVGKPLIGPHVDNGMLKCHFCQYRTKHKASLGRHMRRTHTRAGKKTFVCDICQYKCNQTNVFVEHTRIHTGEKPFSCDKCAHKFARKSDFKRHLKLHIGKKPHSCEFCAHKFARNSDLVRHKRTHTGEKPYCCGFCDHRFSRNSDLVNHKRTHTGEKPYACDLCDYKCARNSELFKHNLRTHTSDTPNL